MPQHQLLAPVARPVTVKQAIDDLPRIRSKLSRGDSVEAWRESGRRDIQTLFLDCAGAELERRFSETRRRHPMAEDRPAADGIAREREMMEPLRRWAEHVVDTTNSSKIGRAHV